MFATYMYIKCAISDGTYSSGDEAVLRHIPYITRHNNLEYWFRMLSPFLSKSLVLTAMIF